MSNANQPSPPSSHTILPRISFGQLLRYEWQIKHQGKGQWLYALVLFGLIITLFPLAMGTEANLLTRLGAPAIWIGCLLSILLGVDGLFRPAVANGTLAQLITAKAPLHLWVLAKLLVHWVFSAGILVLLCWLAIPLFGLNLGSTAILAVSVLVASPLLLLQAALASSLTVSIKNGAMLVPMLALPLQLPILIFATGAVELHNMGMQVLPTLALLLAGSILSVIILPWIIAHTLKMVWLS